MPQTALIGRQRELADLRAVVDAAATRPIALLLLGEAGAGKTALLGAVAADARRRGLRVLPLTPAGAGPYALVRGRADEAALLRAVDRLTADRPALILVDRADRADPESLRLLTRLMRATSTERIALVLAARTGAVPAAIGPEITRYELGPLTEEAAGRLLDAQPVPARPRAEILRRAAGNPLALITFADPAAPVPAEFGSFLDGLGVPARRLLRHAAVAGDDEDIATVSRAAGGRADLRDWEPAEAGGLIRVVDGRVRFAHPLVRAACAADGSRADLDRAHQNLGRYTTDPHRRARHLAAATSGPYEAIAAGLEDAAGSPGRYGDQARALEAAAERSADPADAARRYARAVFAAYRAGDPAWAAELHERATARTADPDVLGAAACGAGLALLHAGQPTRAFELTRAAVRRRPGDPQVAMTAVTVAATAALMSGVAAERAQLPGLLALVGDRPGGELGEAMVPRAANPAARASVLAIADPAGHTEPAGAAGAPMTGMAELARMLFTGTVAWLRDDSGRAVAELHTAWRAEQRAGAPGAVLNRLPLLVTAMIDTGRWADADRVLDEAERLAAIGDVALVRAVCPALRAILRAHRQDGPAPAAAEPAEPVGRTLTGSLRQRAAGLSALAAADHPTAYRLFRALFDDAGEPMHYFLGPRSLPQLALAAARTGQAAPARRILAAARERAGSAPTARMAMLLAHAAALLDGDEEQFHAAVGDPDRALRWPLEFAEAQLTFGRWLRGQRRQLDARPHLLAALDTFQRLGAHGHAAQVRRHLPAGGHTAADTSAAGPPADAFGTLTAQKQTIARLAADGLTNREIADRLSVSPRTVGSHLYDIYPVLGVSSRHQLRELLAGAPAGS